MSVYFTSEFTKNYKKIKGKDRKEIDEAINEIITNPEIGKPLKYTLKGLRSYRIGKMRIIYTLEREDIYFITLGARKNIYNELKRKYG